MREKYCNMERVVEFQRTVIEEVQRESPETAQLTCPFVAATLAATVWPQFLPPSTDTSTFTVSVVNRPLAVQTKGTVPFVTPPASPSETVLIHR